MESTLKRGNQQVKPKVLALYSLNSRLYNGKKQINNKRSQINASIPPIPTNTKNYSYVEVDSEIQIKIPIHKRHITKKVNQTPSQTPKISSKNCKENETLVIFPEFES